MNVPTPPQPPPKATPRRASVAVASALSALAALASCASATDPGAKACTADVDCAALDDADRCNGRPVCALSLGVCVFDPATAVTCDASLDTACSVQRCQPATGTCAATPAANGSACEDGDACTLGDGCDGGSCEPGADACACRADADCKDDGDLCNGTPICDKASFPYRCATNPATIVTCAGGAAPCMDRACDPKAGTCQDAPQQDGSACSDGDDCTIHDACKAGACQGGKDACACSADSDCPDLDGDLCNGTRYCDKAAAGGKGACKVNPATVVTCPATLDTACAKGVCLPTSGACVQKPIADKTACDDGAACTSGDVCIGGSCQAGKDTCKCSKDADCGPQEDGDACNGTLYCDGKSGACLLNPATVVSCPTVDDTACAKNVCQKADGACKVLPRKDVKLLGCTAIELGGGVVVQHCVFAPKQAAEAGDAGPFACDDGDPCSKGDVCEAAVCKPGAAVCECQADADCLVKDDGDLCNGVPYCAKDLAVPACKPNPASAVFCDKKADSACLKATCAPKTGACALQPLAAGTPCDDDEPCTAATACQAGECKGGPASCDDGDACTTDACQKGKGCTHIAKVCADGNDCTPDACDAKTGACTSALTPAGAACNADGNGCTIGDACDGKGSCKAGAAAVCSAKTGPCHHDVCQSKGADGFVCAIVQRPDGFACPDGDPCLAGAACKAGSCQAGTTPQVFATAPALTGLAFEAALFPSGKLAGAGLAGADGGGGLLLAGGVQAGADAGRWRVLAYSRTGVAVWQATVQPPSGATSLGAVIAILDRKDLGVLVVGRATRSDGSTSAALAVISAAGQVTPAALVSNPPGVGTWRADAAALHPSGVVVSGVRTSAPGSAVVVLRALSGGGGASFVEGVDITRLDALLVRSDGGVVAGGAVSFGVDKDSGDLLGAGARTWILDGAFQLTGTRHEGPAGQWHRVGALVARPDGLVQQLRLTSALDGTAFAASWQALDVPGNAPAELRRELAAADRPLAAVGAGDGIAWVGAPAKAGVPVGISDRYGNVRWRRDVVGAPPLPVGLAVAADRERLVIFGADGAGATAKPRAIVVDRWGFAACSQRGKCAGLSWAACQDASDCSADGCDPVNGCTHAPVADNLCSPGVPCTTFGTCATGACQPYPYGRTYVSAPPASSFVMSGMTVSDAGQPVTWSLIPQDEVISHIAKAWTTPLSAAKPSGGGILKANGVHAPGFVARNAKGRHVLIGTFDDGKRTGVAVRGYDSLTWADPVLGGNLADSVCTSCSVVAVAALAAADGALFGIGQGDRDGGIGVVIRVGVDAAISAAPTLGGPGSKVQLYGAAARSDGGIFVVGSLAVGAGPPRPRLDRLDDAGKSVTALVDAKVPAGAYRAAVERADGGVVVAGAEPAGSLQRSLVVAYGPSLTELWRASPTLADGLVFDNLAAAADGTVLIAGTSQLGGQQALVLERRDAGGSLAWQRSHRYLGQDDLVAVPMTLHLLADGSSFVGARAIVGGVGNGRFSTVRADASGYISCAEAGGCAALALVPCADSNPCTLDFCDAKGGCQHQKLDGAACPAGGSCKAGQCVKP